MSPRSVALAVILNEGGRHFWFGEAVSGIALWARHASRATDASALYFAPGLVRMLLADPAGIPALRAEKPCSSLRTDWLRAMGRRNCAARSSRSAWRKARSLRSNFENSSSTARMKCSRGDFTIRVGLYIVLPPG